MGTGFVYRHNPRVGSALRRLTFFHARFVYTVLVSLALLVVSLACITTPRTITVDCFTASDPKIVCHSSAASIWGRDEEMRAVVEPRSVPTRPFLGFAADKPASFADLYIGERTVRSRGFDSKTHLVAQFVGGQAVALTGNHPSRTGTSSSSEATAFRDALREGRSAVLVYRSGWGGLVPAVALALLGLLIAWLASGRTSVTYNPNDGRIETRSTDLWLLRANRIELRFEDIAEVTVASSRVREGGSIYRPALRLRTGAVVALGTTGLRTAERAEHWARELGALLDLPAAL